ncbi:MAG: hypothetical protein WCQ69_07805 [Bacteroidales bacterium]
MGNIVDHSATMATIEIGGCNTIDAPRISPRMITREIIVTTPLFTFILSSRHSIFYPTIQQVSHNADTDQDYRWKPSRWRPCRVTMVHNDGRSGTDLVPSNTIRHDQGW